MKKSIIIFAALLALTSCRSFKDEWTPVFTGKYADPDAQQPADVRANTTIAQLVAMYEGAPLEIRDNLIIEGRVTTTDQPGNFYKSLYIQDTTGGIELKIGKNGLYNDYLPGQKLYVKCKGLTIGMYGYKDNTKYGGNGMVSIGFADPSGQYETSYMENTLVINSHIFKGETGDPVEPVEISENDLPGQFDDLTVNKNIGRLVTLKGLRYANEVFCLLYLNSNLDKKSYTNRVFLSSSNVASNPTCGITTWAMSKVKMTEYLCSGLWDEYKVGSGSNYTGQTLGDLKGEPDDDGNFSYPGVEKNAYSVSQYFTMGSTTIQIRTSGYGKFADAGIPESVLKGDATIDVTGILTLYEGSIQFTLNSLDDVVVNE